MSKLPLSIIKSAYSQAFKIEPPAYFSGEYDFLFQPNTNFFGCLLGSSNFKSI